jgi:hypothetical protein
VTSTVTPPKVDLQTALAAMADYPAMLRRLGVIRILEVDLAGTGIDPATIGTVHVSATPEWDGRTDAVNVAPVAVPAFLSPKRFALTEDGRVDPTTEQLDVAELDTDSAVARHVDLARQVVNAEDANATGSSGGTGTSDGTGTATRTKVDLPDQLALPSLRNAGLSVFQGDRAVGLRNRLLANRGLLTAEGAHALDDANHAVKGLVVDVWDDHTKRWHTLCARRGTYRLPDGSTFSLDDLGAVSMAVTSNPNPHAGTPMYLHQSLLRWTGWSLVAPPPGQPVETETPGKEADPGTPVLPGFDVAFAPVPGTLPTLRFGRGYRFQLRTVDLVGQVDPLDPASQDFSRAVPLPPARPVRHLRFEPVISPIVVAQTPMTEGESLEVLVVRPEPGLPGGISNLLGALTGAPPVRHLVAPKVSEALCEQHGMVDRSDGRPDPSKYAMLAARDRANLADVGQPDPRVANQRYVKGNDVPVTWLPDPIARGVAIAGLPSGLVQVPFQGSWPAPKSWRLQVADGTGRPAIDRSNRKIVIPVPRGETFRVRLSSYVDVGDLDDLGQVSWLMDSDATSAEVNAASADIVAGQAWQVTPYRTLELVNAVRVPVTAPKLSKVDLTPTRDAGSHTQSLGVSTVIHRQSTGQLALNATWTDPVDDLALDHPTSRTSTATPATVRVEADPDPSTGQGVEFPAVHALGDTRRHQVTYSVTGTTRYLAQFTQRGVVTFKATDKVRLAPKGFLAGSEVLRSTDGTVSYRRDVDYDADPAAGTIGRLDGGKIPAGTGIEVALVPLPVSRTSGTIVKDIPSTVRPDAPKVAWIVPTFGWSETSAQSGRQHTRVRSGGGLRIFLERPWYSSGVGEQLAVLLADGAEPTDGSHLADVVTQLGADPIVARVDGPGRYPTKEQLTLAKIRATGRTLPGVAGTVAVAAHDVTWDAERQRWACDIVLPPGRSYQPFVRLVVARYQHGSLDGVELSAPATAQWAQLTPDRSATVTADQKDQKKITLTVVGRSALGTAAAPGQPNRITVLVQTNAHPDRDDLAWTTVGDPAGMVLPVAAQTDGSRIWTAPIVLPTSCRSTPYRLVLMEHEQLDGGGRLVYSDVIRL